uniref:Uncharacterized protein n=1 Tax=Panagrolaimus davidi TaxID=227884 RepID=A0A914QTB1_9BILA
MANLDERFLDGPNVGYCSDSDDEEAAAPKIPPLDDNNTDVPPQPGNGGPRTGPKGVLNDYQLHQEELRQSQKERDRLVSFFHIKVSF